MAEELSLMFTLWIRNDATGEATQIKGQGTNVPAAFKDGWDNANEAFGKDSGGGYISLPRISVTLRNGEKVLRSPQNFASRKPYDRAAEEQPDPVPTGDAAKTHAQLVDEGRDEWAQPKTKP